MHKKKKKHLGREVTFISLDDNCVSANCPANLLSTVY